MPILGRKYRFARSVHGEQRQWIDGHVCLSLSVCVTRRRNALTFSCACVCLLMHRMFACCFSPPFLVFISLQNPAKFTLYWKQPDGAGRGSAADSGSSPIRLSRELLDTEKLVFFTGENAEIPNVRPDSASGRYAIVVHVRRESPTHLQSIRLRPIYFNIVLEELFHGVPYPVFRIVVWAVVGLWLIWRVLIPKFFSRIWPFSAMYSP